MKGRAFVGISGFDYPGWKGPFYPPDLPRSKWLAYAGARFDSVELNGTFYSLKRPEHFERWRAATPEGFVFAVKGSRFITHMKKLREVEVPLANFFASGVLALGRKTGPFLWQLPEAYPFDRDRVGPFLSMLPRDTDQAAAMARRHDARLAGRALTRPAAHVPLRHALEARHPSYFGAEARELLEEQGVALVEADTAGRWTLSHAITARFGYVRLHGSEVLYASRYSDRELARWASRVRRICASVGDAYVYFDNDAEAHAPRDAMRLARRLIDVRGPTAQAEARR